jgi:hypothetical protein
MTIPAHARRHVRGGNDPIRLDDLAEPEDNRDLDANTLRHGLMPKLTGDASDVYRGDGTRGKVSVLEVLTADPGAPANDTWWMVRTGSSPTTVSLKARIGGVTYVVAAMEF